MQNAADEMEPMVHQSARCRAGGIKLNGFDVAEFACRIAAADAFNSVAAERADYVSSRRNCAGAVFDKWILNAC